MGGKGELVNYQRLRATTKAERDKLKQEISDIIDQTAEDITLTVITLVEEPKE
jgi:hypothetical protein